VLLAPTLPILVVSLLTLRPRLEFMFVPSLSQHLLLIDMVKNEPLDTLHVAISVTSTLAIGALLTWLCAKLYRREGLLG
jgi:ABC-type Na+ efflux pump permease subunit